ncbi:hypothetical protein OC835_007153, partial [Tilletia horrida]
KEMFGTMPTRPGPPGHPSPSTPAHVSKCASGTPTSASSTGHTSMKRLRSSGMRKETVTMN